jgi:8-oxo-dGTP pyrophosphatase MutT (NUDIX family)
MNKNNNICNNCGKLGHLFHQCKIPITSYGIILCRSVNNVLQFLMIRRKDSFGYIDFLRGKYMTNNKEQLQHIFNEISIYEKERIKNNSFETLWRLMWGETNNLYQYKNEELSSQKKMDLLKNGVMINGEKITIDSLIEQSDTAWNEPEWEFPKGRRNYQEKDLDCAIREFEEETGFSREDIYIIENLIPFEEIFIGSNHKSYKHKYYLAYMDKIIDNLQNYQTTEVSKLEWKTLSECIDCIRPYNLEKKRLIININKVLEEYRLY